MMRKVSDAGDTIFLEEFLKWFNTENDNILIKVITEHGEISTSLKWVRLLHFIDVRGGILF
jgi:hypothetical protein